MKEKIVDHILKKPFIYAIGSLIVVGLLSAQAFKLKSDYSVRIWFKTTDPLIKDLDQLEKTFGNDETLVLNIHAKDGAFNARTIELLGNLTEDIWQISDIIRVDSLTNYNYIEGRGDNIVIRPFLDHEKDYSSKELKKKKDIATRDPLLRNRFVSKDGENLLIRSSLRPTFGDQGPNYKKIVSELEATLENYDLKGLDIHTGGNPVINDAYRTVSETDLGKTMPLMFGLMIILLILIYRTWQGVLLPLGLVIITILSTYGYGAILGLKFNNMTSAVPGILIAICMADAVHILTSFYQKGTQTGSTSFAAAKASLIKNFTPTLVTSISTSIGFLSLLWTELLPVKHLALMASFGTLLAWVLTYTLIAPILQYTPLKKIAHSKSLSHSLSSRYLNFLQRHSGKVIGFYALLTLGLIIAALQNQVSTDPLKHFSKDLKVRKDMNYIIENYGGVGGPDMIVDSGKQGGIKEPQFLRKVDQLSTWLKKKDYVGTTVSILPIIKDLNQKLHQGKESHYKIPDARNKVGQVLFFYSMGLPPGMDLNNLMSMDNRFLRLSLIWELHDSQKSLAAIARIKEKAQEIGLDLRITGKLTLYHRMSHYIVDTFLSSIGTAVVLIGLLMVIVLRSLRLGFLSLVPNVIPLIMCAGLMTLFGIAIDIGTSLVIAVCFGIVVDDTTHFLTQVRSSARKTDIQKALVDVMRYTAPALIFTTVILSLCFGVFLFGDFLPNVKFGLLCSLTLMLALIIDLTLLPALILKLRKTD